MPKCKACGAEIKFIKTVAGKSMPVNTKELLYWADKLGDKFFVTKNGETIRGFDHGTAGCATGIGYVSHYSTCPEAARFRKG